MTEREMWEEFERLDVGEEEGLDLPESEEEVLPCILQWDVF